MSARRTARTARSGTALCLLAALLGAWPVNGAAAGCTGPLLGVGPAVAGTPEPRPVLERGAVVTVSGRRFHSGCDDTGQGSGCGAPETEQAPLTGVQLVLEQGSSAVVLGTADAGDEDDGYAVTWQVRVPAGLAPGPAVLRAATAHLAVELRP